MSKQVSRRGFLGILGAAGAAAVIPLSWEKPEGVAIVDTPNHAESLENPDFHDYVEGLKEESIIYGEGTRWWTPNSAYSISYDADLTADAAFGDWKAHIPATRSAEIECTVMHQLDSSRKWLTAQEELDLVIDTGEFKFKCNAYLTEMNSTWDTDALTYTDLTFRITGEMTRYA